MRGTVSKCKRETTKNKTEKLSGWREKSDKDLNSGEILSLLYNHRYFDIIITLLGIYLKEVIG